jgi:hypothetical protein
MTEQLKCFISSTYGADMSLLKSILTMNNVEVSDVYDMSDSANSTGEVLENVLKRKMRQSDFALFVISKANANIYYEMGICEGLGKQHFILLDKDYAKDFEMPFDVRNKPFLSAKLSDQKFLQLSVETIIERVKTSRKHYKKSPNVKVAQHSDYDNEVRSELNSYLGKLSKLRENGTYKDIELIVEGIFKTLTLNYVQNAGMPDKGVDFALWSDSLGRIIGNPIIVEVKYGKLSTDIFDFTISRIKEYAEKSDAKLALFLYLDRKNRRFKFKSSLKPLIITFDLEDFVSGLISHTFENLILSQRNKIAHGIE